jgi:hypothetical protein
MYSNVFVDMRVREYVSVPLRVGRASGRTRARASHFVKDAYTRESIMPAD